MERMTTKEEIKCFIDCTWGNKSHLNLFGKIIFTPVFLTFGSFILILHLLFSKRLLKEVEDI